ncbi:MAG: RsmD family RNA methyltransferase, partial [Acidimicrobiales bacterium]
PAPVAAPGCRRSTPPGGAGATVGGVRVIAGSSRGRRLPARLPAGIRPTSDRVKESIFDILGSMGVVPGADVLDLYCGSGALGLEALSRGARSVTFVDHDGAALDAVRANRAATGLAGAAATLVRADLPGWLGRVGRAGLALCDPPYAFGDWAALLGELRADVAVLESAAEVDVPEGWVVARSRRYGGTLVTVVTTTSRHPLSPRRAGAPSSAPAGAP